MTSNQLLPKVETHKSMNRAQSASQRAFDSNSLAGLVLLAATVASLAVSNSALSQHYDNFLLADLDIRLAGNSIIHKPLLHWINEGMSLFIGSLAFEYAGADYQRSVRLGVLIGSTVSATAAIILLKHWLTKRGATHPQS